MVIDPSCYQWADGHWTGVRIQGQVLYDHLVGTFTPAGTFRSAIERFPDLVDTGVTLIEVMPLADFTGRFGWGYDGVNLFAPCRLYGTPDDFRAFIDAAHSLELGVILDVVYNHFGPEGNTLREFSSNYLGKHQTEWGDAPNFDGPDAENVRRVRTQRTPVTGSRSFTSTVCDSTRRSRSSTHRRRHIIAEIRDTVVAASAGRDVIVVGENEPQEARIIRPRSVGGYALDALWNDDFHHAARVAATGRDEAYFSGYRGVAQEFVSAAKYGFLYQGQWFRWQNNRRGGPAFDLAPTQLITVHAESRPGGEYGERPSLAPGDEPRSVSRAHGTPALAATNADVVPGPGVRCLVTVSLLRRSHGIARRNGARRSNDIRVAVLQHRGQRVPHSHRRSHGSVDLITVQARLERAACARSVGFVPPRSASHSPRGRGDSSAAHSWPRRRGAQRSRLRIALLRRRGRRSATHRQLRRAVAR